jgi:HAD superfamily hydrolase (TIGR01509 family)
MVIKGILFDFDGVLANTMNDLFLAWKKAFQTYNIKISNKDYFPLEGMKLVKIANVISKKYGILNPNLKKIVELKNKYYLQNHSFSFYNGVEELINSLKERKLLAIVSASPKEKLEHTVPNKFLNKFNCIVSADDTIFGKPHPEPYLMAAKKLGLEPSECLVVENAPLGIKSAKKAGIYCITIESTLDKSFLNEADMVIKNFDDLRKLETFQKIIYLNDY